MVELNKQTDSRWLLELDRQPMDINFYWPSGISGLGVNVGQGILYRKNPLKMPCHVQLTYDQTRDISAGPTGTKIITPQLNATMETWRYHNVTEVDLDLYYKLCKEILNTPYDFYFFGRWALLVSIPFIPWFIPWWTLPLYLPSDYILKRLSKNTWACSEEATMIYYKVKGLFSKLVRNGSKLGFDSSSPFLMYCMVQDNPNWVRVK